MHVCLVYLVVKTNQLHKAVNVIHGEIFGISKKINIAVFGHGLVGGTLINQILNSRDEIEKRKGFKLNIFAIANSRHVILDKNGVSDNIRKCPVSVVYLVCNNPSMVTPKCITVADGNITNVLTI